MDKKKKIRVVVIVPVIVTVIIICAVIYFVLQAASVDQVKTYNANLAEATDPAHMTIASNEGGAEAAAGEGEVAVMESAACAFDQWIGHTVNEDEVRAVGRPYRILGPDSMATMDFSPARINVMVDDKNVVIAVRCG